MYKHSVLVTTAALLVIIVLVGTVALFNRRLSGVCNGIDEASLVRYTVLEDKFDSRIKIAIPAGSTNQQVSSTLAKAADEHAAEAGRDLLFTNYFFLSICI